MVPSASPLQALAMTTRQPDRRCDQFASGDTTLFSRRHGRGSGVRRASLAREPRPCGYSRIRSTRRLGAFGPKSRGVPRQPLDEHENLAKERSCQVSFSQTTA
jgi:hypothetical protein